MNWIAQFNASAMCLMRTLSSRFILNFRRADDLVSEIAAEILGGAQVDLPPSEQRRKLKFDFGHREQAWCRTRLEFHEQIDVAVEPVGSFQRGTEQGQPPDAVAPAKGS